MFTAWDENFGEGISITDLDTGNFVRATSQGVTGLTESGSGLVYGDSLGRAAMLDGLKSEEMEVLLKKHLG